uniref:Uncharacterized protein n=1 Tax=Schizaphis graminum TaxID=13262 RepID=A0A2S2PA64_SCHGA
MCSGTFGAQKRQRQRWYIQQGEGGAKRRRFSVEPPERLYVRTLVRVRVYNTIKWRFLLNGRELRGRTGGGGGCCGRNRSGGAGGSAMTRWTGRRTAVTG